MTISAGIALVAAIWSMCSISLLPPGIHVRHLEVGAASVDVLVDAPHSWILSARNGPSDFDRLARHADLAGNLISSDPARRAIARRAGVSPGDLTARTRLSGSFVAVLGEPDFEERANQILNARKPYGIDVQVDPLRPVVHIYTRAPSAGAAIGLADAVPVGLATYLRAFAPPDPVHPDKRLRIVRLGTARGAVTNSHAALMISVMTFLVVLGICWALMLLGGRVVAGWREATSGRRAVAPIARIVGKPDDWPHTTRALPWMVAGFLGLLWLIPFNTIKLHGSLPFDLKLDRIVLPVLILVWILSIAAGARDARRPHLTAVHVAVGTFLAVAFLSVVLNAHDLNQGLEFSATTKKMILLGSYGCFFLLVASVIRRSEVPAFLTLTLGLAVVCAMGTIWEYRFHSNVFYDLSSTLLPKGVFDTKVLNANEVDEIGRRLTRGPAEHPLELAAMLSMALPIALVGMLKVQGRPAWKTFLYGCAACLLIAAAISTYRKSALLAPLSVALTLAYFRRAALVRLAPLLAVAAIIVHVLSPGAFGSIIEQVRPDRLGVGTVTDRTSDYDALRPDLWTHLFFGRGFGSYDHVSYRILDSEILGLVVGVGIVGLLCYIGMLAGIVLAARRPTRSEDRAVSNAALAIAAGVVAFAVVSFLFDVLEFPHAPYILLSLAGLLAVVLMGEKTAWHPPDERVPTRTEVPEAEADTPIWGPVELPRVPA